MTERQALALFSLLPLGLLLVCLGVAFTLRRKPVFMRAWLDPRGVPGGLAAMLVLCCWVADMVTDSGGSAATVWVLGWGLYYGLVAYFLRDGNGYTVYGMQNEEIAETVKSVLRESSIDFYQNGWILELKAGGSIDLWPERVFLRSVVANDATAILQNVKSRLANTVSRSGTSHLIGGVLVLLLGLALLILP